MAKMKKLAAAPTASVSALAQSAPSVATDPRIDAQVRSDEMRAHLEP